MWPLHCKQENRGRHDTNEQGWHCLSCWRVGKLHAHAHKHANTRTHTRILAHKHTSIHTYTCTQTHQNTHAPQGAGPRVGRYVVDVSSFENTALPELQQALHRNPGGSTGQKTLCVMDEIGEGVRGNKKS
jgi:hypothetical protein